MMMLYLYYPQFAAGEMRNLYLKQNSLDTSFLQKIWMDELLVNNFGACITFIGIVRKEESIDGLSFDIYEPLLKKWFLEWNKKSINQNCSLFMAHSIGDVKVGEASFMCALASKNRKEPLSLYVDFIEDFKSSAPIWKYDLIGNNRIYAKNRSKLLPFAGVLNKGN